MRIPHTLNASVLLLTGFYQAVHLNPLAPDFHGAAIATLILFLLALASAWCAALVYSNKQRRIYSPQRFHRLQKALYRRASTNASLTR